MLSKLFAAEKSLEVLETSKDWPHTDKFISNCKTKYQEALPKISCCG